MHITYISQDVAEIDGLYIMSDFLLIFVSFSGLSLTSINYSLCFCKVMKRIKRSDASKYMYLKF